MPEIYIQVEGLDKLIAKLDKFGDEISRGLEAAGKEAGQEIIDTVGLSRYPPEGKGNVLPYPFYIRKIGTQVSENKNLGNSEKYGTQFFIMAKGLITTIGNRASYARYLAGLRQSKAMAQIGWRKLYDVAKDKIPQLRGIYQRWINYLLKKLDLK
jgi:hypothetical protein